MTVDVPAPPDYSDLVLPRYDGWSIANIPATIAALLNAPPLPGLPPLDRTLWTNHTSARRVIVLVLDATGYNTFAHHCAALAQDALVITSVFPSTTVAALSSLWTGLAPVQHGLVGTRMWLRDYGVLAQMIGLKTACKGYSDHLVNMGLKPETFLPSPNLPEHLAAVGIPTHDFIPHHFKNSGLTRILHRGVQHIHPVVNVADALCKLRHLLNSVPGQPLYAHIYHGDIDSMSHYDGPSAPSVGADLGMVAHLVQHELVDQLSRPAAQDTLLIITADHGQIHTPLDRGIALHKHSSLWRRLLVPPGGEPRAGYLFVRNGDGQQVRDYIRQNLAHAIQVIDTQVALESGWWGPPPYHPRAIDSLGDMVVLLRENYWLADPFDETPLFLGWHGGLDAEEMHVPLLIVNLSGV